MVEIGDSETLFEDPRHPYTRALLSSIPSMDPDHRTLLQVTMDDAAAADQVFSVLMGEDVESRRNFIQQNARDVRFLDI